MEDFEMKQALRRYVERGEPPFSLTAGTLISEARRRQRWRVGLSVGCGSAATTLAVVSAMVLVPAANSPVLDRSGCDVRFPLRAGATEFSPQPWYFPTGFPTVQPTDGPTGPPTDAPAAPTGGPVTPPTAMAGASPTTAPWPAVTAQPTPAVTTQPTPGGTAQPTPAVTTQPTTQPTAQSTVPATSQPAVPQDRLDEMSCFLKRRMVELRPDATFSATAWSPPLEPVAIAGSAMDGNPVNAFTTGIYVIEGSLYCEITITVYHGTRGIRPGIDHLSPSVMMASTLNGAGTVVIVVDNRAISDEDAMAIAKAPELDLYR